MLSEESAQRRTLQAGSKDMVEAEKQGYAVMQSCGFVLLAGGLGERLGHRCVYGRGIFRHMIGLYTCVHVCMYACAYMPRLQQLQARCNLIQVSVAI